MKGVLLIGKSRLIFISNELIRPEKQRLLNLPLHFITFAHVEGKMYKHYFNHGNFMLKHGQQWGNRVVYGAVFALEEFDFYIRILDSYHQCSMSTLRFNHPKDVHHREEQTVTCIKFDTLDDFSRLKYVETREELCHVYIGNKNHPKINQRLDKKQQYRIIDGIDDGFVELYREVSKWKDITKVTKEQLMI